MTSGSATRWFRARHSFSQNGNSSRSGLCYSTNAWTGNLPFKGFLNGTPDQAPVQVSTILMTRNRTSRRCQSSRQLVPTRATRVSATRITRSYDVGRGADTRARTGGWRRRQGSEKQGGERGGAGDDSPGPPRRGSPPRPANTSLPAAGRRRAARAQRRHLVTDARSGQTRGRAAAPSTGAPPPLDMMHRPGPSRGACKKKNGKRTAAPTALCRPTAAAVAAATPDTHERHGGWRVGGCGGSTAAVSACPARGARGRPPPPPPPRGGARAWGLPASSHTRSRAACWRKLPRRTMAVAGGGGGSWGQGAFRPHFVGVVQPANRGGCASKRAPTGARRRRRRCATAIARRVPYCTPPSHHAQAASGARRAAMAPTRRQRRAGAARPTPPAGAAMPPRARFSPDRDGRDLPPTRRPPHTPPWRHKPTVAAPHGALT